MPTGGNDPVHLPGTRTHSEMLLANFQKVGGPPETVRNRMPVTIGSRQKSGKHR